MKEVLKEIIAESQGNYGYQHYSTFQDDNNFTMYEAKDLIGEKLP
jgi:quinol monooxygenase YgiN